MINKTLLATLTFSCSIVGFGTIAGESIENKGTIEVEQIQQGRDDKENTSVSNKQEDKKEALRDYFPENNTKSDQLKKAYETLERVIEEIKGKKQINKKQNSNNKKQNLNLEKPNDSNMPTLPDLDNPPILKFPNYSQALNTENKGSEQQLQKQ